MSASASASASASTSTHAPSLSPVLPSSSSTNNQVPPSSSADPTTSTSPSSLPHSPETLRQIAEARAALEASMHNIGASLDHTLKSRAQTLHANSAQLTKQEKDVIKATEGLRKETDKLKKVAEEGQKKVKELGNVQNWAEMLERDFLLLEETLRLVRNGNRPREGGSGDYEGSDWETSGSGSWSGSERGEAEGERDEESIAGDERRGKVWGDSGEMWRGEQIVDEAMIDGEGDTLMQEEGGDKGKGKDVDGWVEHHIQQQAVLAEQTIQEVADEMTAHQHQQEEVHPPEVVGGSSTATATESSVSDPSTSSVHTAVSTTS